LSRVTLDAGLKIYGEAAIVKQILLAISGALLLQCTPPAPDESCGFSEFHIINKFTNRMQVSAATMTPQDSILSATFEVQFNDTGYIGKAIDASPPSPSKIFSRIIIQRVEKGDTVYNLEPMRNLPDSAWEQSVPIEVGECPGVSWYYTVGP
jgi:hypothetical protein